MNANIILASASSYRAASLRRLNLSFKQHPPQINETPQPNENPRKLASRLAEEKALSVATEHSTSIVIGCDQTGTCNGQLLHKPGTKAAAIQQLSGMSGRTATFYTAMTVVNTDQNGIVDVFHDLDTTQLQLRDLSPSDIKAYVDADLPLDCAGSFKIEALGITLFSEVKTLDPSALQGISLIQLTNRLKQLGYNFSRQ